MVLRDPVPGAVAGARTTTGRAVWPAPSGQRVSRVRYLQAAVVEAFSVAPSVNVKSPANFSGFLQPVEAT
ncbi:hypothetical protein DSM112329_03521 [Paraconexibacter sp. AEG42_29]|uniref:Uncharacterized protein n=1 Tax=Paraconexibacter sp. AEG42_29 TaxID=2997339 RepID=A0AAU7AYD9_9ACTN